MVAFLALSPATVFLGQSSRYDVADVREERVFAGHLGYTVTRTLKLKGENGEVTVTLPSFHDAILPSVKGFQVGDRVVVDHGHVTRA